jgi:hypothetical protein
LKQQKQKSFLFLKALPALIVCAIAAQLKEAHAGARLLAEQRAGARL